MRNNADRGPLFPGTITRIGMEFEAMIRGQVKRFTTWGAAENWILDQKKLATPAPAQV